MQLLQSRALPLGYPAFVGEGKGKSVFEGGKEHFDTAQAASAEVSALR
jgi:hypothetical protein